jgi:hypothetical protein
MKSLFSAQLVAFLFAAGCMEYEFTTPADVSTPPTFRPIAVSSAGDAVKRGVEVVLDGSDSYDPDDDDAVLMYQWDLSSAPAGGDYTYSLVGAQSESATFSAQTVGDYMLSLTVTDEEGNRSENAAGAVIEVVPWEDLSLVLTWDESFADLDLHLLRPDGSYYTDGDCYFGNPEPDWGTTGDSTDNPELSQDHESGGPEIISLTAPEEGAYEVLVHFFVDRSMGDVEAIGTVRIQAEGAELTTSISPSLVEGEVWRVGTVDWPLLAFTVNGSVSTHELLGGPDVNE